MGLLTLVTLNHLEQKHFIFRVLQVVSYQTPKRRQFFLDKCIDAGMANQIKSPKLSGHLSYL